MLFAFCSLKIILPCSSESIQYGLEIGDLITPVWFPYVLSNGSAVTYCENSSVVGSKAKERR